MTATIFTVAQVSGPLRGIALICPAARYASILWRGADRLDRRFATPRGWRELESELLHPQADPLPSSSTVAQVLGVRRDVTVQYLTTQDLEAALANVAVALDTLLRAQPLEPPRLPLR